MPASLSQLHSDASSIFAIPVLDKFLAYAPLHHMAALVDGEAVRCLRDSLLDKSAIPAGRLDEIVGVLSGEAEPPPLPKQGDLVPPFLGLLPTRGCNLACRYCGFLASRDPERTMGLELARDAVNWYMDVVEQAGVRHAEVHYFGGEPFCVPEVLHLTVNLACARAAQIGCTVRFEAATNGVFDESLCQWAADNLDTVVLSLDGSAEVHDRHRPYKDGRGSFDIVIRNAGILSEGDAALFIRACVTDQTVERMPELAAWFCEDLRPGGVCFEPLQPTAQTVAVRLEPPNPWDFARRFIQAADVLESHGVEAVYAAADIRAKRVTFCPVGQDVIVVSPDGTLSACYLLQEDWEAQGLDLCLGRIENGAVQLRPGVLELIRNLNVYHKPVCARCFCKWHCAGGCHVNHGPSGPPGTYDRLCIQTRIITLRNVLKALGQDLLVQEWLENRRAVESAVYQASDLLFDLEEVV